MSLEERKIELQEKWLEFRKEIFAQKQQQEIKPPAELKSTTLNPVFATIMVALIGFLGTAIATIINNYNQNSLEQRKFESELIKKSLEEQSLDNKIKALKLLSTLHLIKDRELKTALDKFLLDTTSAKKELPTYLPISVGQLKIIGRSFTPEDFGTYAANLNLNSWKPQLIVLHQTSSPTLKQWHDMPGQQRMLKIAKFYDDMKWHGGPHLFIAEDSIWVLNPLTSPGVHSPSWNKISIGIEMVGDYSVEPLNDKVRDNTVRAIAILCKAYSLSPDSIKFHSEDPLTTHVCPGRNVNKNDIIFLVKKEMEQ